MAQQILNNSESGASIRGKINDNFTDLYGNKLNSLVLIKQKASSHTMDADDLADLLLGRQIVFEMQDNSNNTFTVPQNSTLAIPIGASWSVRKTGTGILTYSGGGSMVLTGASGALTDPGLNVTVRFEKTGTNTATIDNGSPGTYFDFTSTFTGFLAAPTIPIRYHLMGKHCHAYGYVSANGTSNATTFTLTLPFAAANTGLQYGYGKGFNNSAVVSAPVLITTRLNSNIADVYLTFSGASGTAWTSSNLKSTTLNINYEIA